MFPSPTTRESSASPWPRTVRPRRVTPIRVEPGIDFEPLPHAVERIRSYIAAGDIYQANLTIPFRAELGRRISRVDLPPHAMQWRALSRLLEDPGAHHPEQFTGTIFPRRGESAFLPAPSREPWRATRHDQQRSLAALLASEKDRAENLMIVDLLRNDLGRICDYCQHPGALVGDGSSSPIDSPGFARGGNAPARGWDSGNPSRPFPLRLHYRRAQNPRHGDSCRRSSRRRAGFPWAPSE